MLLDPRVHEAIAVINRMGLSLDCWLYHTQLDEFTQLIDAHPGLVSILNHVGSPILGGPHRGKTDEVYTQWQAGIRRVSERDNVYVKLGAMPSYDGDRTLLPTEEVAAAWATVDGTSKATPSAQSDPCTNRTSRCKNAGAYRAGTYRRISAGASASEKYLFAAAARAYRQRALLSAFHLCNQRITGFAANAQKPAAASL